MQPIDFGMSLVAQPAKVQKIDIGFARYAKRVDVRALKENMWRQLHKVSTATNAPPATGALSSSFQRGITELKQVVPAAALDSVSVSYCFICILHLANEKDLQLIPGKVAETGATAPADAGFCLGDFTVVNSKRS